MLESASNTTVAETTYRQIRADIIFGRLAPGEKLKLDRLKNLYGASVSTLREILSRLAADGLVTAEGQRGFEVAPVSPQDLKEIAALRQLLECYAIDLSFAAGDMDWEGRVVAAYHKLQQTERRMIAGDHSIAKEWKRYDWEFHQALISACGSKMLMDTHAAIFDKYLRYQMISLTFRGQAAADEHRQMRDAALARDAAAAQTVLRKHVEAGVERGLLASAPEFHKRKAADPA
jgi:DNA-binding GntR family transcriptional regulator